MHPNIVAKWKQQLLENAPGAFGEGLAKDKGPSVDELNAKIGQLTMENDFLSGALVRMGAASAKR